MKLQARNALLTFALATIATVASATPSHIFVFGDSLSDSGNNTMAIAANNGNVPRYESLPVANNAYVPTYTYASSGTYSDGQVWATRFATALGVPLVNSLAPLNPALPAGLVQYSTNYAFGGATTGGAGQVPALTYQVQMALAARGNVLPSSALYVVAGGGNNARAIITDALPVAFAGGDYSTIVSSGINNYVLSLRTIITQLKSGQASDIVLWNTPNLGSTPALLANGLAAAGFASQISGLMNQALAAEMAKNSALYSGVRVFDIFGLASLSLPGVNTTEACAAQVNCDPSKYYFYDGIHPTSLGHQIISERMLAFVPVPGTLLLILPLVALAFGASRRRAHAA
jgi:outer membrane lipase/esterase